MNLACTTTPRYRPTARCWPSREATLIALSQVINREHRHYYEALERNNKRNEITDWLVYFATTIIEAQAHAQGMMDFLIAKGAKVSNFLFFLNREQENRHTSFLESFL